MSGGASIYTDAVAYQTNLGNMLELLVLRPRQFSARLTWVDLPHLRLIRSQEASARIAYMQLPPELVFVTFPTQADSLLICGGAELRFGELMLHSRGEHLHQRTAGPTQWGAISLRPEALSTFARTLLTRDLVAPHSGQILRLSSANRRSLFGLHAGAARVAERNLRHIAYPQVAHALDQELIFAVISSLADSEIHRDKPSESRIGKMSAVLETLLEANPEEVLQEQTVGRALGVSAVEVRQWSATLLGMTISRYQRLRRLAYAHKALRHASTDADYTAVIQRYGYSGVDAFVVDYTKALGEAPMLPVRG